MEIRQLKYFIAVVDARSITKAAHLLHVVQSAVSHQIANLESELNAPLLLRSREGVTPTESGRLLYRHAQAALRNLEAARQAIVAETSALSGVVAIGLPTGCVPTLAVPLLKLARENLPHVQLNIHEGYSVWHEERLSAARLDLAVLFGTAYPGFDAMPLWTEKLHFMSANPDAVREYAGRQGISLREVTRWPLLLTPSPNLIRDRLERECDRSGLRLNVVANLNGVQTIRDSTKAGLGSTVTVAVNANLEVGQQDIVLLPITDPLIERPAGVFQLADTSLTLAGEAVKSLLVNLVTQLVTEGLWPGARLLDPERRSHSGPSGPKGKTPISESDGVP